MCFIDVAFRKGSCSVQNVCMRAKGVFLFVPLFCFFFLPPIREYLMQEYSQNIFLLYPPFSLSAFSYFLSNQCHTPKLFDVHWNCAQGTLGIRKITSLMQFFPPPPNREAKTLSGGGNEFCISQIGLFYK